MTRECAWCGKRLGVVPGEGVTHGICERCKREQLKKIGRRAKQRQEGMRC